jgi:hypothetical protein
LTVGEIVPKISQKGDRAVRCERPSAREGTPMEFLADRFEVFGITLQFWMPIIVGAAALYILYLWKRGQLN